VSADGTKLVAVDMAPGYIYTSSGPVPCRASRWLRVLERLEVKMVWRLADVGDEWICRSMKAADVVDVDRRRA